MHLAPSDRDLPSPPSPSSLFQCSTSRVDLIKTFLTSMSPDYNGSRLPPCPLRKGQDQTLQIHLNLILKNLPTPLQIYSGGKYMGYIKSYKVCTSLHGVKIPYPKSPQTGPWRLSHHCPGATAQGCGQVKQLPILGTRLPWQPSPLTHKIQGCIIIGALHFDVPIQLPP